MKLYLFDDAAAGRWHPFALSRPISELRYGTLLQRERLADFAGVPAAGLISRPWLSAFREPATPPVVHPEEIDPSGDRLFLSSRAVPDPADSFRAPSRAAVILVEDEPAGCFLPAGADSPGREWLADPGTRPGAESMPVRGRMLREVWELVRDAPEQIGRDAERHAPGSARAPENSLPPGVRRLGSGAVHLEEGVRIEAGVLLDARRGPIWLGPGVEVSAGCRLEGPLYAGARSRLLGGPLAALSAGPVSYLRGEVEETVTLGHVNKAHEGFLGHAYLGRWVNLGAGTTNSDLKNNYGPVRLGGPEGERETGLRKFGCLLGDHVKTAIGTLLNTGTAVGAGANLFGRGMPPKWVPPFSWGFGTDRGEYRRDAFLETAEIVLGRRDVPFDAATAEWLGAVWEAGTGERTTG